MEENKWKPPGEEEEEEEELDEAVSGTARRTLRYSPSSGLQICQRCRPLRHRSQPINAYRATSSRREEAGSAHANFRGVGLRI